MSSSHNFFCIVKSETRKKLPKQLASRLDYNKRARKVEEGNEIWTESRKPTESLLIFFSQLPSIHPSINPFFLILILFFVLLHYSSFVLLIFFVFCAFYILTGGIIHVSHRTFFYVTRVSRPMALHYGFLFFVIYCLISSRTIFLIQFFSTWFVSPLMSTFGLAPSATVGTSNLPLVSFSRASRSSSE